MACPNCGAPGGGPSGCGSCGLGKDPNVGGAFNAGQDQLRHNSQNKTGGCFTGDSLVLTPNGKKRLENIRKGEHVLCLNEENVLTSEIVKRVSSHARRQVFEVESDNAELSFRATALHPILTSKGWVAVKDICIGDTLITLNESGEKREHVVRRIAPASKSYTVHNIVVGGGHTYIVQGCVAHSFVHFRRLRCLLSKVGEMNVRQPARKVDIAISSTGIA